MPFSRQEAANFSLGVAVSGALPDSYGQPQYQFDHDKNKTLNILSDLALSDN